LPFPCMVLLESSLAVYQKEPTEGRSISPHVYRRGVTQTVTEHPAARSISIDDVIPIYIYLIIASANQDQKTNLFDCAVPYANQLGSMYVTSSIMALPVGAHFTKEHSRLERVSVTSRRLGPIKS